MPISTSARSPTNVDMSRSPHSPIPSPAVHTKRTCNGSVVSMATTSITTSADCLKRESTVQRVSADRSESVRAMIDGMTFVARDYGEVRDWLATIFDTGSAGRYLIDTLDDAIAAGLPDSVSLTT